MLCDASGSLDLAKARARIVLMNCNLQYRYDKFTQKHALILYGWILDLGKEIRNGTVRRLSYPL